MQAKLRVLLADDHPVIREGLRTLVDAQPDMEVVGEAADGQAVIEQTPVCQPHLIMMDLSMPGISGTRATEQLQRDYPTIKILVLSVHEEGSYVRAALRAGASGYILKRTAAASLIEAIRAVAGGSVYIDPILAGAVLSPLMRQRTTPAPGTSDELSEREMQVMRHVASGYTNKEIAAHLGLSVKTVETYKTRAMEKLGVRSRAALVSYAVDHGWL